MNQLMNLLRSYDPMAVLQRGYSITYRAEDDRIIRDSIQLHPGDGIWIQFAKGKVSGQIEKVN
jgi:exodeoxyribonuclease VII large subunit